MVKSIMSETGVKGYFANHSLRATAVSRLFQEGADEKLIKGVTGHRSEALDSYKTTNKSTTSKSFKNCARSCS